MPMIRSPLTLEHALLGFLRRQPMHGYQIYQRLEQDRGIGLVWHLKQSQLYALLGKLEKKGYLTATLEPQAARPPRKVFHLTRSGCEVFLRWVRSPVKHGRHLRLEFLAKLYFAQQEDPAAVAQLIAHQRRACRAWLADQQQEIATIANDHPFEQLVHEFRSGQIEATLAWLDKCEQRLLTAIDLS